MIIVPGYDPEYLRIIEHFVRLEAAAGRHPLVLDATRVTTTTTDSYHRRALRLFRLPYPGQDLAERLTALGAEVIAVQTDTASDDLLSEDLEEALEIAVQGALITYFRTDRPLRSRRSVGRAAHDLASEGRRAYRTIGALLAEHPDVSTVYVPNGRFPLQKMAQLAALARNIDVLHYEKGASSDGVYLQPYAPQDRFQSQGAVDTVLAGMSDTEVTAIADRWLDGRVPSRSSDNQFSGLWTQGLPERIAALASDGQRLVGFFTSSQDEFEFLGPEWKVQEWTNQFHAFDRVMTRLESQGVRCYLRVHPNLATKSHDCFLRERAGVRWLAERHPDLVVIWHDDPANTYSLLEASEAVVVWYSTVGLEASALGLPVWTTAASRYGLVADVREVLSESDLDELVTGPWTVDTTGAKRFIAYLLQRDEHLMSSVRTWLPWDPAHPPLGARIASTLVAGGAPGTVEALKSIADTYRHRGLRANLRHLARRRATRSTPEAVPEAPAAVPAGTGRAAIMLAGYDPAYLRISEHHVRREVAQGRVPLVLDGSSVAAGGTSSYDRTALRLFRLPEPGADFAARMAGLGARVVPVSASAVVRDREPLSPELEETLAIAVQSALITYFRTDKPNRRQRRVARTADALAREGRAIYRGVTEILAADPSIDLVYLPNGRFPHQKMATIAARDAGVAVLHFEKGETPNGSYLQSYAPQDRIASQSAVAPVLERYTDAEVDAIAERWLSRRAPSRDSSNEFAALWSTSLPPAIAAVAGSERKLAGFFTSSQDEFQFLGPEWQLHEWHSQFEAFDIVLEQFEAAGYACYVRVHPNLATKAEDCFVRERAGIRWLAKRHPDLQIIWHDDAASTYSLLDVTDAVVVWDSTVGLEASARGIPVWTVATSRYGLVADVRELLGPDDVDRVGIAPWEVDSHAAKKFIAYLVERDEQMAEDATPWLPWNPSSPPFGAKVAAALAAGGIPYRSEAVRSLLDVYRHRSFAANRASLRKR
ncbi:MAG: hypothetical protein JWR04_2147 [Rhodoglobus sp.]|nr:hypothetical protein [Rhodoglobus sp.]